MGGYRVERSIDAPADTVWALLTDADSYEDWNEAVVSIVGPIEEGHTIKLVSVVDPKRTFSLEVEEMRAPNHMVWSDGMPLGLLKGRRTYTVTEANGGSVFTMGEEFSGLLAPMIRKTLPDMTESFELFADGLKSAAEAAAD